MNETDKTAIETYRERRRDVAALLDWLEQELHDHSNRAERDASNWCYAGDLGYVRVRLVELLSHVSSIPETEIEEALEELAL